MNVKLKRLLLPLLRAAAKGAAPTFRMRSAASQALFLLGKPSSKAKAGRLRRKEWGARERASHNQETAKIYAACAERAGEHADHCECGCFRGWEEMDHFHGRAKGQAVETCWMLSGYCHRAKTQNAPSREYWDMLFAAHCAKYGYEFHPRLVKSLPAKAGGAP